MESCSLPLGSVGRCSAAASMEKTPLCTQRLHCSGWFICMTNYIRLAVIEAAAFQFLLGIVPQASLEK